MVVVPAGPFWMGSETGRPDERPRHRVDLDAYQIDTYEVTNARYARFVEAGGYTTPALWSSAGWAWKNRLHVTQPAHWTNPAWNGPTQPVVGVSWFEAEAFCRFVGKRLPTEAEWEYACRAGTTTALHLGDVVDSHQANFNGLSPYGAGRGGSFLRRTSPVGEYPANKFGLYDMHGNVMEWCSDWYDAGYYSKSPKEDPTGPESGKERVTRGGSWSNSGKACRSAVRTKLAPEQSHYGLGFRVVMVQRK